MKTDLKAKYIQHLINKKNGDEGFTLIELLVVIIIIGILSAIALPSFLNQANKARQSEASTYIGSMNRAQQAYYLEENEFGSDITALEIGIADTDNYTYVSGTADAALTGTAAGVISTATPTAALKGVAGRVWVDAGGTNTATTLAILCDGAAGAVPALAGATECP